MGAHFKGPGSRLQVRPALLATLVVLAACASGPKQAQPRRACPPERSYHVVNHGSHVGIVVEAADVIRHIPGLASAFGNADWLEFGWGDKDYYQHPEPGWWLGLKAGLWPTPSVIHVAAVPGDPGVHFYGAEVVELRVADAGYRELVSFLAGTFALSSDRQPVAAGPGQYGRSRFYDAVGAYTLFRTCNTWAAEAIAASGLPIDSTLVLRAEAVMTQIRGHSPAVNCPAGIQAD